MRAFPITFMVECAHVRMRFQAFRAESKVKRHVLVDDVLNNSSLGGRKGLVVHVQDADHLQNDGDAHDGVEPLPARRLEQLALEESVLLTQKLDDVRSDVLLREPDDLRFSVHELSAKKP